MKLRWRNKLAIGFVLFAVVPATLVALLALDAFRTTSHRTSLAAMNGLVGAKAAAIEEYTDSSILDVQRLAELLAEPVADLKRAEENAASAPLPGQSDPLLPIDDVGAIRRPANAPAATVQPVPLQPETGEAMVAGPSEALLQPERDAASARADTSKPGAEARRVLALAAVKQTLMLLLGEQATFEELLVIAPDGRVAVSTFSAHEGKSATAVEYYKRGRAATFVQAVFESPLTQQLTMVIATPMRDSNNEPLGVLAARLNLKAFFRLINDTAGLGRTGETVVAKILDGQVVLMAPARHQPHAALQAVVATKGSSPPIVAAARGESAFGETVDSRDQNVLAAWTFVPSLEWGIVTKIDVAEVNEPLLVVQTRLAFITIATLGFAILASLLFAGAIVRPLRELRNATQKISQGDFDVQILKRSDDELGELADSFERMVAAIKYFKRPESAEPEDALPDPPSAEGPGELVA